MTDLLHPAPPCHFLSGGGEMGERIRRHDWSTTSLGPPHTWPLSLQSVVSLILHSKFPMFVAWGPELVMLYNDAYAGLLFSKHPVALGAPMDWVLAEIWHELRGLVAQALAGETHYAEDAALTVHRKGYEEPAWFTFSYSPVREGCGAVGGIYCVCTETTRHVRSERRQAFQLEMADRLRGQSDPFELIGKACELLGRHLQVSRVLFAQVDDERELVRFYSNFTDGTLPAVPSECGLNSFGCDNIATLRHGSTLVASDIESDPRTCGTPYFTEMPKWGARATVAVPIVRGSVLSAVVIVQHSRAHHWSGEDITLVEDVSERIWNAFERARAEKHLRAERDRSTGVFESMNEAFVLLDHEFRIRHVNAESVRLAGRPASELIGRTHREIWPGSEQQPPDEFVRRAVTEGKPQSTEYYQRLSHQPGNRQGVWLELRAYPSETGVAVFYHDITARKDAQWALQESEQRFRSLYENHTDAIFSRDLSGRFQSGNAALQTMTGYTLDELRAMPHGGLVAPEHMQRMKVSFAMATQGMPQNFRNRIVRKDGQLIEVDSSYVPIIVNAAVVGVFVIVRDITKAIDYERHIEYLASHDVLTGLPNRVLLDDRLTHAIEQRGDRMLGILFLDLNRFKMVNDSLGHDKGDLLLKMIAERLRHTMREGDTIARQGGDEFVIVVENVESIDHIAAIAENILVAVAEPFNLGGHELTISTSVGASVFPRDGSDAATLLKHADVAMYQAKALGSGTFRFFNAEMNVKVLERLLAETGLRHALERNELVVHYQTRVDAQNQTTIGVEALIRWMHPERGLISPVEFIPMAEEIGLIGDIGEWVLRAACRQNRAWQDAGLTDVKVSVNLSPFQLNSPDFADTLRRILFETRLDPRSLELEITESGLMQDIDVSLETLIAIRKTGVSISIDDFGTGYSSLSYLKRLPIDTLKIDRSFIRDLHHDPDDAAIVAATIALAHNMGLEVVAEGVTTTEQVDFLLARQCNAMQGYLFSKPLAPENIEVYLRRPALRGAVGPARLN